MTLTWTLLDERLQYDGYRKITRRSYIMPDGSAADFEIRLEPLVATIFALTPDRRVLLAEQFRPGPGATLRELPGGAFEAGESPEAAARRELREETGCEGELHFVGETFSGAYSTMRHYNFVALNCRKVSEPCLDDHEFINVVEITLDEFRALLRAGQLTDVATGYLCLDYLGLL